MPELQFVKEIDKCVAIGGCYNFEHRLLAVGSGVVLFRARS